MFNGLPIPEEGDMLPTEAGDPTLWFDCGNILSFLAVLVQIKQYLLSAEHKCSYALEM